MKETLKRKWEIVKAKSAALYTMHTCNIVNL